MSSFNCEEMQKSIDRIQEKIQEMDVKPKIVSNCKWYIRTGRRCKMRGLRDGYCFIHENKYIYNPDGIIDSEGNREPCTNNSRKKFIPTRIKQLDDEILGGLFYIYKGQKYKIKQVCETYAVLELKDKYIDEYIHVWESSKDRKGSSGININQIYTFREFECDERAVVDLDNEEYYCLDCFEDVKNTLIDSICV